MKEIYNTETDKYENSHAMIVVTHKHLLERFNNIFELFYVSFLFLEIDSRKFPEIPC